MLDRVRAQAGRVATIAGSSVLAGGLITDAITLPGVVAAAATASAGLVTNLKTLRAPESAKGTAIAVYCAPHAGAAAILIGERLAPEGSVSFLAQAAVAAVWTGATWTLRPGRLARDVVDQAEKQEITEVAGEEPEESEPSTDVEPVAPENPVARWWADDIAHEGGAAPGTILLEHQQVAEKCVAVIVGAAERGKPVPELSTAALSARLDVPEDLIEVGPVPGRGAGVRLLVIGQRPQPAETERGPAADEELWREIAATAMPGVELIEATTHDTRKELT